MLKRPFFARYQRPWIWPGSVDPGCWSRVEIRGERGTRLVGLYAPAEGPRAKGTIVCAHPMGNEAKAYFLKRGHADLLRAEGHNVLVFDFNGFGESETGSFEYPLDVLAAGRAAKALWPDVPLALMGTSFGGAWSICALARAPWLFRGAVIEATFTTLDEYWVRYPVPFLMLQSMNALLPELADRLRPVTQMAKVKRNVLLIYGEHDEVTPVDMGRRLLRAAAEAGTGCSLWVAPRTAHTKALQQDPEAYAARVLPFLESLFA
jgi:pimeloyl-ACP methyl ester carboxylesterase